MTRRLFLPVVAALLIAAPASASASPPACVQAPQCLAYIHAIVNVTPAARVLNSDAWRRLLVPRPGRIIPA